MLWSSALEFLLGNTKKRCQIYLPAEEEGLLPVPRGYLNVAESGESYQVCKKGCKSNRGASWRLGREEAKQELSKLTQLEVSMRKTVSDVFQPQTWRGKKCCGAVKMEQKPEIWGLLQACHLSPVLSKGMLQSLGWKMRRGCGKDGAERESQAEHHMGESRGMGKSPSWGWKSIWESASQECEFVTPECAVTAFREWSKEKRTA